MKEVNPFDPKEYTLLTAEKAANWKDTPHDGACLFHALYQSYRIAHWLPNAGLIESGADMRTKICEYIRDNGALFQAQHSAMIRAKAAVLLKTPMEAVTYEEALPVYCRMMRREAEWGGYPEIDAAARMLNVMVHEFRVPGESGARHTALLHATFYPIQSQLDNKAERKQEYRLLGALFQCCSWSQAAPRRWRGAARGAQPQVRPADGAEHAERRAADAARHLRAAERGRSAAHSEPRKDRRVVAICTLARASARASEDTPVGASRRAWPARSTSARVFGIVGWVAYQTLADMGLF